MAGTAPTSALFFVAVVLALIASHPRIALVTLAYSYTVGAIVAWIVTRIRRRPGDVVAGELPPAPADVSPHESGL